jgi:hypothetical protein
MNDRKEISSTNKSLPSRHPILRMRFVVAACVCILFVLGSAREVSGTRTSMQLTRWKEFSYARETRPAGGETTVLEAIRRTGFVVVGNGEFAKLAGWVIHTTTPEGKACYQGLVTYDFQDGSNILAKVDAIGEPNAKLHGNITFISGTKRYKGITGRGTISSWLPNNWDMYAEIDVSYSVSGN